MAEKAMGDYTYQSSKDGKSWRNLSFRLMKERIWKLYGMNSPVPVMLIDSIASGATTVADDGTHYRRID